MKICHLFLFQISYMISAWARMCKILGKEFHQYLPLVMPPVMKTASLKPEMALLDSIPLVMPPVMETASLKPEVALLDSKYIHIQYKKKPVESVG